MKRDNGRGRFFCVLSTQELERPAMFAVSHIIDRHSRRTDTKAMPLDTNYDGAAVASMKIELTAARSGLLKELSVCP